MVLNELMKMTLNNSSEQSFAIHSDSEEPFVCSAPGKVILFGEHAVVYGKTAVAAAINLRTYAFYIPRTDDKIRFSCPDLKFSTKWKLSDLPLDKFEQSAFDLTNPAKLEEQIKLDIESNNKWLGGLLGDFQFPNSQKAIMAFLTLLVRLIPRNWSQGFNLTVVSSLPVGAGLGSSAAFSVCIAGALIKTFMPQVIQSESTKQILEFINYHAFLAEKILHGNPSGIDNTISTYGGVALYKSGNFELLDRFRSSKVLLTNTKVPRDTKTLVSKVRDTYNQFPEVVTPMLESIDAISKTFKFYYEKNVPLEDYFSELEKLVELNHGLLASLGLSHKSLEHVREVTNKYETKSKLTGAGGGGCALSLLKPNITQMTINSMQNELLERGWDSYSTNMGGPGIAFQNCPNLTSQDFLSNQELSLVAKIPPNWNFLTKL